MSQRQEEQQQRLRKVINDVHSLHERVRHSFLEARRRLVLVCSEIPVGEYAGNDRDDSTTNDNETLRNNALLQYLGFKDRLVRVEGLVQLTKFLRLPIVLHRYHLLAECDENCEDAPLSSPLAEAHLEPPNKLTPSSGFQKIRLVMETPKQLPVPWVTPVPVGKEVEKQEEGQEQDRIFESLKAFFFPLVFTSVVYTSSQYSQYSMSPQFRIAGDESAVFVESLASIPFVLTYVAGDNQLAPKPAVAATMELNVARLAASPLASPKQSTSVPLLDANASLGDEEVPLGRSRGGSRKGRPSPNVVKVVEAAGAETQLARKIDEEVKVVSILRTATVAAQGRSVDVLSDEDAVLAGHGSAADRTAFTVTFPMVHLADAPKENSSHLLCVSQAPTRIGELPHSFLPVIVASKVYIEVHPRSAVVFDGEPECVKIDGGSKLITVLLGSNLIVDVVMTSDDILYDVEVSLHRQVGVKGQSLCLYTRNYTAEELPGHIDVSDLGNEESDEKHTRWRFHLSIPLACSSRATSTTCLTPREGARTPQDDGSQLPPPCTERVLETYVLQLDARQSRMPSAMTRETYEVIAPHLPEAEAPHSLGDESGPDISDNERSSSLSTGTSCRSPLSKLSVHSYARCVRGDIILYKLRGRRSRASTTTMSLSSGSNVRAPEVGLGFVALNALTETTLGLMLTERSVMEEVISAPYDWVLSASSVEVEHGVVLLGKRDGTVCCRVAVLDTEVPSRLIVEAVYRPAIPMSLTLGVIAVKIEVSFPGMDLYTLTSGEDLLRTTPAGVTSTILTHCVSFYLWPMETGDGLDLMVAFCAEEETEGEKGEGRDSYRLVVYDLGQEEVVFEAEVLAANADMTSSPQSRSTSRTVYYPPRVVFVGGNAEGTAAALLWSSRSLRILRCDTDGWALQDLWISLPCASPPSSAVVKKTEERHKITPSSRISAVCSVDPPCTPFGNGSLSKRYWTGPEESLFEHTYSPEDSAASESPFAAFVLLNDGDIYGILRTTLEAAGSSSLPPAAAAAAAAFSLRNETHGNLAALGLVYSGTVFTDFFITRQHPGMRHLSMRYMPLKLQEKSEDGDAKREKGIVYLYGIAPAGPELIKDIIVLE